MAGVYKNPERSHRPYDKESTRAHEADRDKVRERVAERAGETATANADELKEKMDALLDVIDEVLEVNAEEFVKGYVQKGGE